MTIAALANRSTLKDWESVPKTNELCKAFKLAVRKIGYVLDAEKTARVAAYLCGPPGLGKSYAVDAALKAKGVEGYRPSIRDYRALIRAFEYGVKNRMPLVLEEADHLLRSERQAEVLKIATDAAGPRWTVVEERKKLGGQWITHCRGVSLATPLIVTSNQDWRDLSSVDKDMRSHVEAIQSRSDPIYLTGNLVARWEYSCYLAIVKRMLWKGLGQKSIPPSVQNLALEWFTINANRLREVSPRTLRDICEHISYNPSNPSYWQEDLQDKLSDKKDHEPDFLPTGGIPHVFLNDVAVARAARKATTAPNLRLVDQACKSGGGYESPAIAKSGTVSSGTPPQDFSEAFQLTAISSQATHTRAWGKPPPCRSSKIAVQSGSTLNLAPRILIRPALATQAELYLGDALTVLRALNDQSVHLVVTDPPYFLHRMGDEWNAAKLRVHTDPCGVVRTIPPGMKFDPDQGVRLQCFMEPVFAELLRVLKPGGFCVTFSQARLCHRMGMAAEHAGFHIRDLLGWTRKGHARAFKQDHFVRKMPISDLDKARLIASMRGRRTPQLKPCFEPMILAQKPREGTFVENWEKYEVGLVDTTQSLDGKFPGTLMNFARPTKEEKGDGNDHPTVKPVGLISHLIRLFSVEGQTVLDPFLGSGSHGVAAAATGRRFVGVEKNPEYMAIAERRIRAAAPSHSCRIEGRAQPSEFRLQHMDCDCCLLRPGGDDEWLYLEFKRAA